ncbi:MAG: hypothetical protein ACAH07_07890 [Methylophilaceae bacterium]|nr:hypothetical protein [Methyloradius sp.]
MNIVIQMPISGTYSTAEKEISLSKIGLPKYFISSDSRAVLLPLD